MQAAEMLCGTRVYHLVFLISLAIGYVHSLPIQTLPSIPGYIPVYIRHGDQPLEEINPALAEAFHEESPLRKATVLPNVNGPTDISLEQEDAHKNKMEAIRVRQAEINDFLEDEECNIPTKMDTDALPTQLTYQLIKESRARLQPIREKFRNFLKKLRFGLMDEIKPSRPQDFNKVAPIHKDKVVEITHETPPLHPVIPKGEDLAHKHVSTLSDKDKVVEITHETPPLHPVIPKGADLAHKEVSTLSDKEPAAKKLCSSESSKFQKTFDSSKALRQPEDEREENQTLEPKSKK